MIPIEKNIKIRYGNYLLKILCSFILCSGIIFFAPGQAITLKTFAAEITETKKYDNKVYDELKEQINNNWNQGMKDLENVNSIEITGNLTERLLRQIAAGLFVNLKSIKAGALFIGFISFVLGFLIAVSANKNKKIRKSAISVLMAGIPTIMLVLVFGISWYISIFR